MPVRPEEDRRSPRASRRASPDRPWLLAALLVGLTLVVYAPAREQEFLDYDDPVHVTENAAVQRGLTRDNVVRAFTTSTSSIWMPVTYLSHALDCEVYGLDPAGHKTTNVVFHLLNTAILFGLLRQMTGSTWASAFAAALFACHPLNLESVAWIAERKNLTSTFFGFLALWAYARYVERPGVRRYLAVICPFVLSLMSKPMFVTLPFLLLLLDHWPLDRYRRFATSAAAKRARAFFRPEGILFLRDKVPMILVVVVTSVVAIRTQRADAAMVRFESLPLDLRALNALVSYSRYVVKALWPANLAVFYPHPLGGIPGWQIAASSLFLVAMSAAALRWIRSAPYLFVGWGWYLGTLVPVIGLVQVGSQSMADRYAYVPLVGLFVALAWGGAALGRRLRIPGSAVACVAILIVTALAVATRAQLGHWHDRLSLWSHALRATNDENPVAHYSLGLTLYGLGRKDEALRHFRRAVEEGPQFAEAHYNLGVALQREGDLPGATARFREAVSLRPSYSKARNNLGVCLLQAGKTDDAAAQFLEAVASDPTYASAHLNLGRIFAMRGDHEKALDHLERALRGAPSPEGAQLAAIHHEIAMVRLRENRRDEAIESLRRALEARPDYLPARRSLEELTRTFPRGGP